MKQSKSKQYKMSPRAKSESVNFWKRVLKVPENCCPSKSYNLVYCVSSISSLSTSIQCFGMMTGWHQVCIWVMIHAKLPTLTGQSPRESWHHEESAVKSNKAQSSVYQSKRFDWAKSTTISLTLWHQQTARISPKQYAANSKQKPRQNRRSVTFSSLQWYDFQGGYVKHKVTVILLKPKAECGYAKTSGPADQSGLQRRYSYHHMKLN